MHGLVDADDLLEATEVVQQAQVAKGEKKITPLCAAFVALHSLFFRKPMGWNRIWSSMRSQVLGEYAMQRKHSELFDAKQGWMTQWFDPALVQAQEIGTPDAWRQFVKEETSEVYSFPMFTEAFCDMFVEELTNFYQTGLPIKRPNTMNNYGVIVNEIGLEPMMSRLQHDVLQPIAHALFGAIGADFTGHHSFIVRYKIGEDLGLDMHTDDSDVTFNVCLGRDFEGAGLQFCGNQGSAKHRHSSLLYQHRKGHCVVHLGHRRHGADDIAAGERINLIIWNKNSEYRNCAEYKRFRDIWSGKYETEEGPPDKECVSFTHDRDYGQFKEYTSKTTEHYGKGWCPPKFAQYRGFQPESALDAFAGLHIDEWS
eukprot:gnl/MRDRNA2_/MRDRNA2_31765_c0_seq2.p1 gnl/MRDRNA2_/MRDRNA2_31765_c0~~gnl/MRDRNA2_/MRDRNA2_31765_c0_seq2.p1  ORF type:complete len:400 (-),score=49.80 gnl/MRDRNA2_/MRDRNA2_31765_c0_seq2:17-1123(-)